MVGLCPRPLRLQEHTMDLNPSAVRNKARGLIANTWQSQANLSLFLGLLVLTSLLLPSMGFGKDHLRLYSNVAFSILLLSGVAIAWGQPKLFALAGSVACVALIVRWMAFRSSSRLLDLWDDTWTLLAILIIALVLLAQVFRAGSVTQSRIQGAIAVYLL